MAFYETPHLLDIFKQIKDQDLSIAIAVEGGGLRGVVSLAFLKVLNDLGLAQQVQSLSGTSSGAINGAYFLDNNLNGGIQLYREMASRKFVQPLKWPNAMNLDYLFEDRIKIHHPLQLINLHKHPTEFFATVTDTQTGSSHFIKAQSLKNPYEITSLLRATASAPLFSTNKEKLGNQTFNDGHVGPAIPFQNLLEKNVDYVFCLLTQPKGYRKKKKAMNYLMEKAALYKYSRMYKKAFAISHKNYNQQLEYIFNPENKKIIPLVVDEDSFIISKMATDPGEVDRCIEDTMKRFKIN